MSDTSYSQLAQGADVQPRQLLQNHHTTQDGAEQLLPESHAQPTPEQILQYNLFMSGRSPYQPPASPCASEYSSSSSSSSSCSAPAIIETILAVIGMTIMLVVGVLGYKQMRNGLLHNQIPDMSGVIVTLAVIPICVCFFTLLLRMAARKERRERHRDGQIALPDDIDLEEQRPEEMPRRGLMARLWGGEEAAPMLVAPEREEDAPPAYEERATQTQMTRPSAPM